MPTYLKPRDLAARIGVTVRTIREWVAEGRLPAPVRFGHRTIRWTEESLADFIKANAQGSKAPSA